MNTVFRVARLVTSLLVVTVLVGCGNSSQPTNSVSDIPPPAMDGGAPIAFSERRGYIPTRDGTLLAYDLLLPGDGTGKYPTLMVYSGYSPGESLTSDAVAEVVLPYLAKGYALIGVNVRGTGCSGGTFDFFQPVEADDGYDAVEWVAQQAFSDAKVATIGWSYPGITQLFLAAKKPPHLVAAAPGQVFGDIYRDIVYPGGIFNYSFTAGWSFVIQPTLGYVALANAASRGDPVCAQNVAARSASNTRYNPFIQSQEHMWDDDVGKSRSPLHVVKDITVPLYLFQSWQDEQQGSRGLGNVERLKAPYFLTVSNGDHGMYATEKNRERMSRFFDHYVKGVDNGFENEPRVTVWWDALEDTRAPSWTRTYNAWPVTDVEPLTLYLREGERLTPQPPTGAEAADSYVYGGSSSNGALYLSIPGLTFPGTPLTDIATPGPTRLVYTTAPFEHDVVVLGSADFTFWASSSAPDTDFQITLSYLADGRETYVQKGWLRASHRALDREQSRLYRPYQTHLQSDSALLTPQQPVEFNVEIFPFGQAFRAGTQLRVTIEAPSVIPELWAFALLPTPAINTVLHDAQHPSSLTLPVLPGARAGMPEPACGTLIKQSCR